MRHDDLKLGPDYPLTLSSRNNLAETYRIAGLTVRAIAQNQAMRKLCEAKFPPGNFETLVSRNNLGLAYQDAGRLSEALGLFQSALGLLEVRPGVAPPRGGPASCAVVRALEQTTRRRPLEIQGRDARLARRRLRALTFPRGELAGLADQGEQAGDGHSVADFRPHWAQSPAQQGDDRANGGADPGEVERGPAGGGPRSREWEGSWVLCLSPFTVAAGFLQRPDLGAVTVVASVSGRDRPIATHIISSPVARG
ncbi:MAG: tetratricopeptide repeat protein [Isosphaeraceae bacterium]